MLLWNGRFKKFKINLRSITNMDRTPTRDENWNNLVGEIKRQIQHTLLEVVDTQTFERKQIVDLDLRTSGIQKNKKSFLNLEITLFVHKKHGF
jgi:hypothetical protein